MRRILFFLLLLQISAVQFGQIIADHTVVEKYDRIPQHYIDEVKKLWLVVAGESHAEGYRHGLELLELQNPAFAVNITANIFTAISIA